MSSTRIVVVYGTNLLTVFGRRALHQQSFKSTSTAFLSNISLGSGSTIPRGKIAQPGPHAIDYQHKYRQDKAPETSYFATFVGILLSVLAYNQLEGRKSFPTVEAAKPFYNYEPPTTNADTNKNERPTDSNKNKDELKLSDGGVGGGSAGGGMKPPSGRRQLNNFVADVVDAVGHTVVSINVKDHSTVDWFSGTPRTVSNGSGFIVKEDGLILTNAHVVMGRSRSSLSVRLPDGRCFAGHVEDLDMDSDLATIRINARGLPVMPLGNSAQTRIGEWVVAIGSPYTLTNTVTCGVVSSVSRTSDELGFNTTNISYIQTDAAITYGNSGGPLVNLDGEAIGINSMKITAGISFAIPINYVRDFLAVGEVRRRSGTKNYRQYIGTTLVTLTDDLAAELHDRGLQRNARGVLVFQIVVGSPAYLAQLKPGDIILSVNGTETKTAADVFDILRVSDCLKMIVLRGDKKFQVVVTPETLQ